MAGRIRFNGIASLVERGLGKHRGVNSPTIEDIMASDAWARETACLFAADRDILC